jgi:hypothetical protein
MCGYALRPKKESPSRFRLGDCAADLRSVAAKVTAEHRSATSVYDPATILLVLSL